MTSREYIENRFYALSSLEQSLVSNQYACSYGRDAQAYFDRTYRKWAEGEVRPSGKTLLRMLECVPKILSKDELIDLVLLEVRERIRSVFKGGDWRYRRVAQTENLHRYFEDIIRYELSQKNALRWFTSSVLSDVEIKEYNALANFIVSSYLKKIYEGVVRDIALARDMAYQSSCQVDAQYTVAILNRRVNLSANRYLPKSLNMELTPPVLAKRFDKKIGAFILECQIEMAKSLEAGEIRRESAWRDASSVDQSIAPVTNCDRVEAETTHECESGTIKLKTTKLNISKIQKEISSLEKQRAITIVVMLCCWLYPPCGVGVTLLGGLFVLGLNDEIKRKRKEIADYGRKECF